VFVLLLVERNYTLSQYPLLDLNEFNFMIYFLSTRNHDVSYPQITKEEIIAYCQDKEILGLDCEFNKLDPYLSTLLLLVIGDTHTQFVIDATSIDIGFLVPLAKKRFVGHNIKIDYKICKVNGFEFRNVYDTMIAEQRIGLGSGRKNGLVDTIQRRLDITLPKDVRSEFITMDKTSIFLDRHIKYAALDIKYLQPVMEVQNKYISKFDMSFLLYEIEFPLIAIMGDCDLEGFVMKKTKWKQIIKENEKKKEELVDQMDIEVAKLADQFVSNEIKSKYKRNRNRTTSTQLDVFGPPKVIKHESAKALKYSSNAQIKTLFKDLGFEVPTKNGTETVAVPALEAFLAANPEHVLTTLLRLYIEHSGIQKQLSTYGESFLEMINPVTNRLHTVFRHCNTDTGRFASGNSKEGFPNLQNIPADVKFRHCFGVEEGYEVTTCDLSGAELVIMVALSGDKRLLELSKGDMHKM